MTYSSLSRFASRLLAGVLSLQIVIGDVPAFASRLPSSRNSTAAKLKLAARPSPLPLASDSSDLRALLAGAGSFNGGNAKLDSTPLLIHIQDIHGHPRAQQNIETAVDRLISQQKLGGILLEGHTGGLDAALFRRSPERDVTDLAVNKLLVERRVSGAAAALFLGRGAVPPVQGLEDQFTYDSNVAAVPLAMSEAPAFAAANAPVLEEIGRLKKKNFNADLYLTDLAVSRYEDGRMPLVSLLTLLRHRGTALDAAMATILKVQTVEQLYDASEVGTELRELVGKLRGRLTPSESAALFDAAFRFQKGRLRTDEFLDALTRLCGAHSIDLAAYPNLTLHLDHALLIQSVSPDQLYAAVERLRPAVLTPLAATANEQDLLALDRRARLLGKLSRLSLAPNEWSELTHSLRIPSDPEIASAAAGLALSEQKLAAAKNFYRYAEKRNAIFEANISRMSVSANARPLVVVAGGYHADAIARVAAKLGRRYVAFTPATGDLREWDTAAPLRDLVRPSDIWDATLQARTQTLAPMPASTAACARLAATAIARGTLNGRADTVQWGRDVLGYLKLSLGDVSVIRSTGRATVRVTVSQGGRSASLDVELNAAQIAMNAVDGFLSRTIGRLWRALLRYYYGFVGITLKGVGLHTGNQAWIRVIPRSPGSGVNFYRADGWGDSILARKIPGALSYLGRNRRRYTGLENRGLRVSMVEHLLFSLRTNNIWDADVVVYGDELPIMDGGARMYIDALKPIAGWSEPPPEYRLPEPVVFRRDNNTAAIFLPLRDGETDSEVIFIGNYGAAQKSPVEFRMALTENDLGRVQAELGSHPTFLERPVDELRRLGFFRGAEPYRPGELEDPQRSRRRTPMPSFVDASDPDEWVNGKLDLERLARHKTMDGFGDSMILELSLRRRGKWRLILIGTGHRDTAEAMVMVESGYRYPVGYDKLVDINLAELLAAHKISPALHADIVSYLAPYKEYDMNLATSENPQDNPPLPADVLSRLDGAFHWIGTPPPSSTEIMSKIKEYFLRSNGSALVSVSQNVATQQFIPAQIQAIDVQLWDERNDQQTFLVSFSRGGDLLESRPKVAVVLSKSQESEEFAQAVYNARRADESNEEIRRQAMGPGYRPRTASDRGVEHFPKMGPYKADIYSREWLSDQYARYSPVPTRTDLSLEDTELRFDASWEKSGGGVEHQAIAPAEHADVARAAAEMMTDGFLRLFRNRPLEGVPVTGHLIENIDFNRDFMYDPVDKKAALGMIRSLRAVSVEQFIFHVLHLQLTLQIERQSKFPPAPGTRVRKEWQPFADQTEALLGGIQVALEKNFGAAQGKEAALQWFRRYLEAVTQPEKGPLINKGTDAGRTWKFRYYRVQSKYTTEVGQPFPAAGSSDSEESLLGSVDGQAIQPILQAKIAALEGEIARDEVFGTARWLAKLISKIFSLPLETSIRLAPITEAGFFASVGFGVSQLTTIPGLSISPVIAAGIGSAVALIAWMLSHSRVLLSRSSVYAWTPFARLPVNLRLRILGLGALVAALPPIAYAVGGSPLALATVIVATALHFHLNPRPVGTGWSGEALPLLGTRQRIRRNLDAQV